MSQVTWCADSGDSVQKSHCMSLSRRWRARQALLRVDEVGELDAVADEEHGGVVADEVVVALGRVELQREAAGVAPGVGGALLAGDRGEAQRASRSSAPGWNSAARVYALTSCGRGERAERAAALGVHDALGDALAVELRELLDEVVVVQRDRAVGADGQRVRVATRPARRRCVVVYGTLGHGGSFSRDRAGPAGGVPRGRGSAERGSRAGRRRRRVVRWSGGAAGGAQAPEGDLGGLDR